MVNQVASRRAQLAAVYAFCTAQGSTCSGFCIQAEQVVLQWRELCAGNNNLFFLGVEAQNLFYQPVSLGQLTDLPAVRIVQVKVAEAIFLALVDELAVIPRQENDRVLRLYILVALLFKKSGRQFACFNIIPAQLGMILIAVQLDQIKALFIRRPTDVSEIAIGRVSGIEIDTFAGSGVVDAYFYLVAGHPCHRVADVVDFGNGSCDIDQGILGYHTLIHPIEREQIARGTPESSFLNSEFVAMNRLAAYDTFRFVGYGPIVHIQIVAYGIGYMSRFRVIISIGTFLWQWTCADNLTVVEIVYDVFIRQGDQHKAFLWPWETDIVEVLQLTVISGFQRLVYYVAGGERCFFSVFRVYHEHCFYSRFDTLVTPPLQAGYILGRTVGSSTRNQILQGRHFRFLCHNVWY